MSQAGANSSSGGGGGGGIVTINVDGSGSVTGSVVDLFAHSGSADNGSTVTFTAVSPTEIDFAVQDANSNIMIGAGAGSPTLVSSGASLNVGIGIGNVFNNLTTGSSNISIGGSDLNNFTSLTTGSSNTGIGNGNGNGLVTGSFNFLGGWHPGSNLTLADSNNVFLNSNGVAGDSNVIRIASDATFLLASKCFIGGINSSNSSGFTSPLPVFVDSSTGQLGFGASGGAGITTIHGDSGSVTGSSVTISAQTSVLNSGSSVSFSATGTDLTLNVSDSGQNTIIGNGSGNITISGNNNNGVGVGVLGALSSGSDNNGLGLLALNVCNTGNGNTAIGSNSLTLLTTGERNQAIGPNTLNSLVSGTDNIAIGTNAGLDLFSNESSNIYLNNVGGAESNTLRIGAATGTGTAELNAAFIQGISGITVTGAAVLCSTAGQLGTIASSKIYKENIVDVDSSILGLRPVKFNYISDKEKSSVYGLIAEEVAEVFPDLVLYRDGKVDSVKYHEMPALLLAEIQRLNKRIEALEAK